MLKIGKFVFLVKMKNVQTNLEKFNNFIKLNMLNGLPEINVSQ